MTKQELIARQTEYLNRIRAGERELIVKLWELLRPLTARYISRYNFRDRGERLYEEADLWQESYIALVSAVDEWQPERGSFANVYLWAIQHRTRKLRGTAGSDAIFNACSLDEHVTGADGSEGVTRGELIEDENGAAAFEDADHAEYLAQLRQVLAEINAKGLTAEQRAVIDSIYYKCRSVKDTAEALSMTDKQCKKLKHDAINVYRSPHYVRRLHPFHPSYSGVGLSAFRTRQASSVELEIERLDRLEHFSEHLRPETRERLKLERRIAEIKKRFGCDVSAEFIALLLQDDLEE